jgi:hypothetical protein
MVRVSSSDLPIISRDLSHSWILLSRSFALRAISLSGHRSAIAAVTLFRSAVFLGGDDRVAVS